MHATHQFLFFGTDVSIVGSEVIGASPRLDVDGLQSD